MSNGADTVLARQQVEIVSRNDASIDRETGGEFASARPCFDLEGAVDRVQVLLYVPEGVAESGGQLLVRRRPSRLAL